MKTFLLIAGGILMVLAMVIPAIGQTRQDIEEGARFQELISIGAEQKSALKIHDKIYMAIGFGNTFMVITDEGNVVIDTSIQPNGKKHKALLKAISKAPVKYIILTHAHADHIGGLQAWKEVGTEIIQQKEAVEFMHWQTRMQGQGNYAADIPATILFDDTYTFQLGGIHFELYHTPGETYDHLTVWIPEYKAAFPGDNFYGSFPNLYTLRGTKPRWALDYVNSLNKVMELKPEILLPSHGMSIYSNEEIASQLTKYRNAILYVHDETVKGMAAGKDRYTLMREIRLPPELELGEGYGRVDWSVRGIYEGYRGYFDGKPANLFSIPPSAVYPTVVTLSGGPGPVIERAKALASEGKLVEGLHLVNMALSADPCNVQALEAKRSFLQKLLKSAQNPFMDLYINTDIQEINDKLKKEKN